MSLNVKPFKPSKALQASYAAFTAVTVIIIIKTYGYYISGSTAMLASLVDSAGDAVISFVTFLSLRLSLKPADEDHRHGHGKAEGFSALFQSSFLLGAAIFLVMESIRKMIVPTSIQEPWIAIIISCISMVITIALVAFQKHIYKQAPSLALQADQKHYLSDIFLNLAVIVALLVNVFGTFILIDVLTSLAIAGFMGWSAYKIASEAIDMLMDREIDPRSRKKIIEIVTAHKDVFGIHDLRTRKSGMYIHISFDIELDPKLTLQAAHDITRDLDDSLLTQFPNAEIIIHKDPIGDTHDSRHKVRGVHHS